MRDDKDYDEYMSNSDTVRPQALFKYRDIQTARQILSSRQLRNSSPVYFRGMNDCQWHPLWPYHDEAIMAQVAEARLGALLDPYRWPSNADREWFEVNEQERLRIELGNPAQRQVNLRRLTAMFDKERLERTEPVYGMLRRMRLLCLTECPLSPAMWMSYAEKFSGVVLGFSTLGLMNQWRRPFEQVIYRDEPPGLELIPEYIHSATYFTPSDFILEKFDEQWPYMKPTKWCSEREWRLVTSDKKGRDPLHSFVPFNGNALESLTFGPETNQGDVDDLTRLARQLNSRVTLYRARTTSGHNGMESVLLT